MLQFFHHILFQVFFLQKLLKLSINYSLAVRNKMNLEIGQKVGKEPYGIFIMKRGELKRRNFILQRLHSPKVIILSFLVLSLRLRSIARKISRHYEGKKMNKKDWLALTSCQK